MNVVVLLISSPNAAKSSILNEESYPKVRVESERLQDLETVNYIIEIKEVWTRTSFCPDVCFVVSNMGEQRRRWLRNPTQELDQGDQYLLLILKLI